MSVLIQDFSEADFSEGALEPAATATTTPTILKPKRGRKPKYNNDVERKEAKRLQNKAYRDRKKEELIELRRKAAYALAPAAAVEMLANADS